jgi:DNA primase
LRDERGIDWEAYPFYISEPSNKNWFGRLIIPFYKDNKLIFYQGRDLSGLAQRRYLSPSIDRERVLYGYENLDTNVDEPLYIVEGFFDAFLLNGIALFGNHLYDPQIKWLNQSRRQKVIIPDRYGDGDRLAKQAIELGWSVSTPDAPGCKDVSDIVKKYGMLYTLKTIYDNTAEGFAASTKVSMYCKKEVK